MAILFGIQKVELRGDHCFSFVEGDLVLSLDLGSDRCLAIFE
jgi:hypothetical protein